MPHAQQARTSRFDILFQGVEPDTILALEELYKEELIAQADLCEAERAAIGVDTHEEHRPIGDARPSLRVHPMDYMFQKAQGHDWRDPDFQAHFARTHPYSKVNCKGGRIVAGHGTKSDAATTKRFTRNYGAW